MPVSESLAEAEPQVELAAAPTMATPPVEPVAPPPLPGAPAVAYAPPASNGFAVAALVLGIVALVMFFTVWLPILLGALAIVFGALGISKANKMGGRQKGLAIAGLVCGAAAIVIGILFVVVIVNVFNGGSRNRLCVRRASGRRRISTTGTRCLAKSRPGWMSSARSAARKRAPTIVP